MLPDGISLPEDLMATIERAGARVRVGFPLWLRPFLQRNVVGITLGRSVFLSAASMARGGDHIENLLRHELVHVDQVRRLGLPRFFYRYVAEYIRLRRGGMKGEDAYRNHPFELEASAAEARPVEVMKA